MEIFDLRLLRTLLVIVFAGVAGGWIREFWQRRPRLVAYQWHAVGVQLPPQPQQPPGQPNVVINVHTIIVRNAGRRTARKVRMGHNVADFTFTVWPPGLHTVEQLADGSREIRFDRLVPKQQISVTYLYAAPLLAQHINRQIQDDSGDAYILQVVPRPIPPRWAIVLIWFLMSCGAVAVLYTIIQLVRTYWPLVERALTHN